MSWFLEHPELLKDVADGFNKINQPLTFKLVGHRYIATGRWEVRHGHEVLDSYRIKITFPDNYPESIPSVYEVEGKIPRSRDRHLTPHQNWEACLFVSCARWEVWPLGTSFEKFLSGPVNDFFIAQSYFEKFGSWPFGDYKHGDEGRLQYFMEKLKVSDPGKALNLVKILLEPQLNSNVKCPCGSKMRILSCHRPLIEDLKKNISEKDLKDVEAYFSHKPLKSNVKNKGLRAFRKFFNN